MNYSEIIINGIPVKFIPLGDCACGCGGKTTVAKCTNKPRGHIKDRPIKFLHGHNVIGVRNFNWNGGRKLNLGYWMVLSPGHPRADSQGYVREHRLIVEKALGKDLPKDTVVHHVEGNIKNNANNNLVLCQDTAYHNLLHQRTRALKACGNVHWLKCKFCKQYDDPQNMTVNSKRAYHRLCNAKYEAERKEKNNLTGSGVANASEQW